MEAHDSTTCGRYLDVERRIVFRDHSSCVTLPGRPESRWSEVRGTDFRCRVCVGQVVHSNDLRRLEQEVLYTPFVVRLAWREKYWSEMTATEPRFTFPLSPTVGTGVVGGPGGATSAHYERCLEEDREVGLPPSSQRVPVRSLRLPQPQTVVFDQGQVGDLDSGHPRDDRLTCPSGIGSTPRLRADWAAGRLERERTLEPKRRTHPSQPENFWGRLHLLRGSSGLQYKGVESERVSTRYTGEGQTKEVDRRGRLSRSHEVEPELWKSSIPVDGRLMGGRVPSCDSVRVVLFRVLGRPTYLAVSGTLVKWSSPLGRRTS